MTISPNQTSAPQPLDWLAGHVVAMSDEAFARAFAAALRFRRRDDGLELPRGRMAADGYWRADPEEAVHLVDRPPKEKMHMLTEQLACKTLGHCAALEQADYYHTVYVKHWLLQIEASHRYTPEHAPAHRSALKLERACTPDTPPAARKRVRL